MNTPEALRAQLAGHSGGGDQYRHAFNRTCTYTEGVRDFAEHAGGGAYWLLDILMTQPEILTAQRKCGIVFIDLEVADGKAVLNVKEDSGIPPLYTRNIDFTDCPEGTWKFFFGDSVLMLPGEY